MLNQPQRKEVSDATLSNTDLQCVAFATYRNENEMHGFLRAFKRLKSRSMVVVLALSADTQPPRTLPAHIPIVQTGLPNAIDSGDVVGWFISEPEQAVRLALASMNLGDGLMLLFPTDWQGDPPEMILEAARLPKNPLCRDTLWN